MTTTIEQTVWTQSYSGLAVDLPDPRPEQIRLGDIAVSLARQARYNGHTVRFYSVAQHCVIASQICEYPLAALMHDAHEAYVGDITRPMKLLLGEDKVHEIENCVARAIWSALGLDLDLFDDPQVWKVVKRADLTMYALEKRQLMADAPRPWGINLPDQLPDVTIVPWSESQARRAFTARFLELTSGQ